MLLAGAVLAVAAATALASAPAIEVVGELVARTCVRALTEGESDPSTLPVGSRRLTEAEAGELGFGSDAVLFETPTRDGAVWVQMVPSCSVLATVSGADRFIDAISKSLASRQLTVRNRRDERDEKGTTTTLEVPVSGRKFVALIATYVTGEQDRSDPFFQVTAIAVEKP